MYLLDITINSQFYIEGKIKKNQKKVKKVTFKTASNFLNAENVCVCFFF